MYLFKITAHVRLKGTNNHLRETVLMVNSSRLGGPSHDEILSEFSKCGYEPPNHYGLMYMDICKPDAPHSFVLELDYNSMDYPSRPEGIYPEFVPTIDTVRVPFVTYDAAWARYKRAANALRENPGVVVQVGGISSLRLYDGDKLLHEAGRPRRVTADTGKP